MSKSLISGIIIDKTRFSDKSLIIKILASDGSLFSGIYFESKSKLSLQYLNFYQVVFSSFEGKDLHKIHELNLDDSSQFYEFTPDLTDQYFVLSELCKQLFREEDPGQDIFSFLNVELRYFSSEFRPDFHILFLAKLITLYGYMPERPYEGRYFDYRSAFFQDNVPVHPDYVESRLIIPLFDFVNGNVDSLLLVNARDRYNLFTQLLRFTELQKGIRLSLKSIEILRDLRQ